MHLACKPPTRGNGFDSVRKRHNKSADTVAKAGERFQREAVTRVLSSSAQTDSVTTPTDRAAPRSDAVSKFIYKISRSAKQMGLKNS